jgi:hypothetical protein
MNTVMDTANTAQQRDMGCLVLGRGYAYNPLKCDIAASELPMGRFSIIFQLPLLAVSLSNMVSQHVQFVSREIRNPDVITKSVSV